MLTKGEVHSQQMQVLQVSLREQAHSYRVKRRSHNSVWTLERKPVGVSLLTKGSVHSQQMQGLNVSIREQAHSYRVERWSHNLAQPHRVKG